jgi:hypothetical protein
MIISHRHRYVFVEVPRTGSTAISAELRENYDGAGVLRKHASYRDFLRVASEDERSYFTFAAVRNPLDVAVTRYIRLKDDVQQLYRDPVKVAQRNSLASRLERRIHAWVQRNDADFATFLQRWYLVPYDTWTTLDHDKMNAIIRFENLAADFDATLRRIGIEPLRPLPMRNATPGKEGAWESHYTPEAIKRAVWVFGPYMERWGYGFPDSWGEVRIPWWSRVLYRVAHVVRSVYWKYFRFGDYVQRRPGGILAIPPEQRADEDAPSPSATRPADEGGAPG